MMTGEPGRTATFGINSGKEPITPRRYSFDSFVLVQLREGVLGTLIPSDNLGLSRFYHVSVFPRSASDEVDA